MEDKANIIVLKQGDVAKIIAKNKPNSEIIITCDGEKLSVILA